MRARSFAFSVCGVGTDEQYRWSPRSDEALLSDWLVDCVFSADRRMLHWQESGNQLSGRWRAEQSLATSDHRTRHVFQALPAPQSNNPKPHTSLCKAFRQL